MYKPGDYTVTVVGANGCAGISTPYTVLKGKIPPKPMIIRKNDTLECTLTGFKYEWYLNGTRIIGAIKSTYIVADSNIGKRITVKISDSSCSNFSDPFLFSPLSLKEDVTSLIKVYPNPAQQILFFEFPSISNLAKVSIINVQGKALINSWFECQKDITSEKIRIQELPPGSYTLRIEQDMQVFTIKFVKQ
ncbi:T9SS C-terminal target domain-containing protein [bacterium]|nr:T9SS C-terminal target domain-containing protein [bacterium]